MNHAEKFENFLTMDIDANNNVLVTWKKTSESLDEATFKEVNLMYIDVFQEKKYHNFMIDTTDFFFPIEPALQTWVATEIISKLIALGINKVAFVVSEDFYAQLSIEQTMDEAENKDNVLDIRYFDKREKVMNWFNG